MLNIENSGRKRQVNLETDECLIEMQQKENLQLNHNILDFQEDEERSINDREKKKKGRNKEGAFVPMNESILFQYMLLYRVLASLSVLTVLISFLDTYQEGFTLLYIPVNNVLTFVVLWVMVLRECVYSQLCASRKIDPDYFHHIGEYIIILVHPTPWTSGLNNILSMVVSLRIIIVGRYFIYSSQYYQSRSYRLLSLYGLNHEEHFFFAFKSLLSQFSLMQIFCIQFLILILLTHCLYLISLDSDNPLSFLDCLEVIIVTIPTVGFGDYYLTHLSQKIFLAFVLIFGLMLNSFIIFAMLKELEMNEEEESSYQLQKKIQAKTEIQNLSLNYLRQSIGSYRFKERQSEWALIRLHLAFRSEYKKLKGRYTSIQYIDMDHIFSNLRDGLIELGIKNKQTKNMINVFLKKITTEKLQKQYKEKVSNQKKKRGKKQEKKSIQRRLKHIFPQSFQ